MFGIGSTELLVILVVALIVLGPKSLASFSRTLGKAVGEFRRVSTDFQRTLNAEAAAEDAKRAAKKQTTAAGADIRTDPTIEADLVPPPDSPIAQAIAKAKAEAEGSSPISCAKTSDQTPNHGA